MSSAAGAKLELRLKSVLDTRVDYEVSVVTPEATFRGLAELDLADGALRYSAFDAEPPAWTLQVAHSTLRELWRNHRAERQFPRRVARWRPAPEVG